MNSSDISSKFQEIYRFPEDAPSWMKGTGYIQWIRNMNLPDPREIGYVDVNPQIFEVASKAKIFLRYVTGLKGILPGGQLLIVARIGDVIPDLQNRYPRKENYVSCRASNGAKLEMNLYGYRFKHVFIKVLDQTIPKHESIQIILGDDSEGGAGLVTKSFCSKLRFEAWVDFDGSGQFIRLQDQPILSIVGGSLSSFDIIIPSIIFSDKKVKAVIRALDKFRNIAPTYIGNVHIESSEGCICYRFEKRDKGILEIDVPRKVIGLGKIVNVRARDEQGLIDGISNPSILRGRADEYGKGKYQLFWGDLHVHTSLASAAHGTPFEAYNYARNIMALDFCAITEHDHFLTREKWSIIRQAAADFYEPYRFVTFLGYAWTHGAVAPLIPGKYFGHKCVYFPTDVGNYFAYTDMEEAPGANRLWQCLEGTGAMVIPHHTAYPMGYDGASGVDWKYHNPCFERLVEIYSRHGNSEKADGFRPLMIRENLDSGEVKTVPAYNPKSTIQGALARGVRVGFVGGTDTQLGLPGNQIKNEPKPSSHYNGGITAVYAEKLTRTSLWEALWKRRCYATTGLRIILSFKINGNVMGEEFTLNKDIPRKIHVEVLGSCHLDNVTVVKNNEDWHIHRGTGKHAEFVILDEDPINRSTYYYVRVIQRDGEMAWSSPIWIDPL